MGIFRRYRESRAIAELTERMETCERQLKSLRMEWEDAYDRLRHTMGRLNKRAAREEQATETENGEDLAQQPTDPTVPGPAGASGRLSDRQRRLNLEILKRRGGL